jgi:hypothetical protein
MKDALMLLVMALVLFGLIVAPILIVYWIVEALAVSIARKAARAIDEDRADRRYGR